MYVCYALSKGELRSVRAVSCQNWRVLAMGCRGRGIATGKYAGFSKKIRVGRHMFYGAVPTRFRPGSCTVCNGLLRKMMHIKDLRANEQGGVI